MAEELTAEEKAELAQRRAAKAQAERAGHIVDAIDAVEKATEGLTAIKASGDTDDEVRIIVMNYLRAAINHINEAG